MNTDIGVSNAALDFHLRTWRCGEEDLRVSGTQLRRCCTDGRERNRVLPRVAALQMRAPVISSGRRCVVRMGRQPVVVLGMIVIVVRVGVQRGRHARRREYRRDEQQCHWPVHRDECMGQRHGGSKDAVTAALQSAASTTIVEQPCRTHSGMKDTHRHFEDRLYRHRYDQIE